MTLLPSLALLAIPALSSPPAAGGRLPAPRADELSELVEEQARAAADLELEELWQRARSFAALGDEEGAAFDAALDAALGEAADYSGRGRVFLAAARLLGEEVDHELVVRALRPVLANGDPELAPAVAALLGARELARHLDEELRADLAEDFLSIARDASRTPTVRAAMAVAAFEIGTGAHVTAARSVLYDFLESSDPNLRAQGALAFGELGYVHEVRAVESELSRLAMLPGREGSLARAYIDRLAYQRHKETELQRARQQISELAQSRGPLQDEDLDRFDKILRMVREMHIEGDKVTRDQLVEAAVDGMLQSLDRHSAYFGPDAFKRFEQDLEAEYGGIGAYVREDDDKLFTITRPIYSGPAYHAGLMTDDKIVKIDDWPTLGQDTDEIIKRLKGRPGTEVKLYVWREGMDPGAIDRPTEDMAVLLSRAQIVIPTVQSEMLPGGIGLVELADFSRVASRELESHLDALLERGARGFVFDVRNNNGGLLTEAASVANLFLPQGKLVVSTEARAGDRREYHTKEGAAVPEDVPVVVLINRFSASAAEIVAGALQDHARAKLVGQRSFGKGSVQNLLPIPGERDDRYADENGNRRWDNWETIVEDHNGNGEFDFAPRVKLTVERYLLPTGRSIHREVDDDGNIVAEGGIEPDVEVAARRWPQWKLEEILRIQRERTVSAWARAHWKEHRELFVRLADGDMGDSTAYPGFDELYAELGTVLTPQDVRFLVRREVRRLVQDERGQAFPQGDYQEDVQLQQALRIVLDELGEGPESVEAYAATFDPVEESTAPSVPLAVAPRHVLERGRLDAAQALIAEARDGDGHISKEGLHELEEILRSLREN